LIVDTITGMSQTKCTQYFNKQNTFQMFTKCDQKQKKLKSLRLGFIVGRYWRKMLL